MIAYFEALLRSLPPEESEAWRKMIANFEALPPEGREAQWKSAAAGADED